MAKPRVYHCLVSPIGHPQGQGIYGCSMTRAKAVKALAAMEARGAKNFGIVQRASMPKHLKPGFWYGSSQLAGTRKRRAGGKIILATGLERIPGSVGGKVRWIATFADGKRMKLYGPADPLATKIIAERSRAEAEDMGLDLGLYGVKRRKRR